MAASSYAGFRDAQCHMTVQGKQSGCVELSWYIELLTSRLGECISNVFGPVGLKDL